MEGCNSTHIMLVDTEKLSMFFYSSVWYGKQHLAFKTCQNMVLNSIMISCFLTLTILLYYWPVYQLQSILSAFQCFCVVLHFSYWLFTSGHFLLFFTFTSRAFKRQWPRLSSLSNTYRTHHSVRNIIRILILFSLKDWK